VTRGHLQSNCCRCTKGGNSYVSKRGVAHRAALSGDKGARVGAKLMPERIARKIAPCPARRALKS